MMLARDESDRQEINCQLRLSAALGISTTILEGLALSNRGEILSQSPTNLALRLMVSYSRKRYWVEGDEEQGKAPVHHEVCAKEDLALDRFGGSLALASEIGLSFG